MLGLHTAAKTRANEEQLIKTAFLLVSELYKEKAFISLY